MRTLTAILLMTAVAGHVAAQDLMPKAPPQKEPVTLVNATIHPVSGPRIESGYIQFANGRITDLGALDGAPAFSGRVFNCAGKHVYPGLLAAYTQLGLTEIGAVRATRDMDEVGAVTPEVRAAVAVNPDSTLLPVARTNGVLTAGVFPTGGVMPGRAGVIRLDGWTWEDMAIRDDAGLVAAWPLVRPVRARWMEKTPEEQIEEAKKNLSHLKEAFARAQAYHAARAEDPGLPVDLRWEALGGVLPGPSGRPRRPVFFLAEDYGQIVESLRFSARNGLRAVIVGGRDTPLCIPLLLEHEVSVIVNGTLRMPKRADSDYDEPFRLPAKLHAAGVRWCLASGQGAANERNLPYAAAMAVAHGLPEDAAIRAITLSAAEILDVDDLLGSLEPGKLATLIVTDGSPLLLTTRIERAWIDGRQIDLGNKQTTLGAKYREKYRQLGLTPREEK